MNISKQSSESQACFMDCPPEIRKYILEFATTSCSAIHFVAQHTKSKYSRLPGQTRSDTWSLVRPQDSKWMVAEPSLNDTVIDTEDISTCLAALRAVSLLGNHQIKKEVEEAFYKNATVCVDVATRPTLNSMRDGVYLYQTPEINTVYRKMVHVLDTILERFRYITLRRLHKQNPYTGMSTLIPNNTTISQIIRITVREGEIKHTSTATWSIALEGADFNHREILEDFLPVLQDRMADAAQKAVRARPFIISVLRDVMKLMLDPMKFEDKVMWLIMCGRYHMGKLCATHEGNTAADFYYKY